MELAQEVASLVITEMQKVTPAASYVSVTSPYFVGHCTTTIRRGLLNGKNHYVIAFADEVFNGAEENELVDNSKTIVTCTDRKTAERLMLNGIGRFSAGSESRRVSISVVSTAGVPFVSLPSEDPNNKVWFHQIDFDEYKFANELHRAVDIAESVMKIETTVR